MEWQGQRKSLIMLSKLYDVCLEGDLPSLHNLLQEDPLLLDRCIIEKPTQFLQTPLHIATSLGHLDFMKDILLRKPELAEELDLSKRWSPLHIASSKGNLETVRALLMVKPNICLARDHDGKNPVHVAAINGHIHVLEELIRAKVLAAKERTNGGETILHLCVKYNQSEALKKLLDIMDVQLLNSKDGDGNTILHLAVSCKHPQMVELIINTSIDINAINTNGLTAIDILSTQPMKDSSDEEILYALKLAKALPAKDVLKLQNRVHGDWFENQRSALMVVASLLATMAFQVGTNPPGGLWQDDSISHIAGTSILTSKAPGRYNLLLISNTVGLVSSLSVIILLISGLPCKRLYMGILMFTMWIAATSTTFTYLLAILLAFDIDFYKRKVLDVNPKHWTILYASLIVWDSLMAFLLLGHVMLFIVKRIRK